MVEPDSSGGNAGYLTSDGMSGLESSARDALTRVVNSQEVQNLGEGLRTAGLKVCTTGAIQTPKSNAFPSYPITWPN